MQMTVPRLIVAKAVGALATFCKRHQIPMNPENLAHFAMAWHDGERFEYWIPGTNHGLWRIIAVSPLLRTTNHEAALIYDDNGFNDHLTMELHETILKATNNAWPITK